ncbi:MAG: MFS transporter [Coriobacteriales bacterium]|jgi:UMF1 family MFS transporter|nr:MFS transporter [Coriobacteriales bacterium]
MAGNRMNGREWSWVLYDVGNSAFIMFSTAVAPIYFSGLAEGSAVVGWGMTETVVSLIVALLMPFLGSLADYRKNKKKFFIGAVGTGVVACAALSIPSSALGFLAVYVIAAVGVNSSMVFYDAFLVDATKPESFDSVSSKGYAWGYIGSLIPFLVCIALIFGGGAIGIDRVLGTKIGFVITAIWWAAFSLPLIRNVHQTHFKAPEPHALRKTFVGLGKTVRAIIADRKMLFFILAFFCYIDGVHTIIKMATSFGTDLGIDSTQLVLALVVTQLVAFPSALLFGKLSRRVGTRIMLIVSVSAYALITVYAAFFLKSATEFWILAIAVGLFQGGIQALSRSYFGKLIPLDRANEYYGFFDIFGKYAAILGTFLMSSFTRLTGSANWGILSITVLFILGLVFLILMPKSEDAQGTPSGSAP